MVEANEIRIQRIEDRFPPYELFMLLLCAYSLISLMAETFFALGKDQVTILDTIDSMICGIFLLDFLIGFGNAPRKLNFLAWGWIDLLSSIPAIDLFQAGRLVRVIRILRVLRGVRLARVVGRYLQNHRAYGTFLAAIFLSILILLLASVAILQVETEADSNIKGASDALWWAIVTMTTVGYGDRFPVTVAGRIIASCLMLSGVGLFGALSGTVTSWILNPVEERQEIDLDAIHGELAAIHQRLDNVISRETVSMNPDLKQLIEAWPHLPEATRRELERLVTKSE